MISEPMVFFKLFSHIRTVLIPGFHTVLHSGTGIATLRIVELRRRLGGFEQNRDILDQQRDQLRTSPFLTVIRRP